MFTIIYKKIFLFITIILFVVPIVLIGIFGLRFGIDFTGGSLLEVVYTVDPTQSELEAVITPLELGGFTVRESQEVGGESGFLIRTRDLSDEERVQLEEVALGVGENGEITRFTSVGPVIGAELKDKALWAIVMVSLIIVLYVAYAFAGIGKPVSSWVYGAITILILIHDILIPTALMSILGVTMGAEIDVLFVMAILAVLGYSVNDTIVVFDRVRENLKANRTEAKTIIKVPGGMDREQVEYTLTKPFPEIVGSAVSQSMGRSVNTSLTTFITLTALFFFGGVLTQTFALVLMAGVLAGTYSSIFIASPLLVAYAEYKATREGTVTTKSK